MEIGPYIFHSEVEASIKQMTEKKARRDDKEGVYSDCWVMVASG
jgi:hypothetical protein